MAAADAPASLAAADNHNDKVSPLAESPPCPVHAKLGFCETFPCTARLALEAAAAAAAAAESDTAVDGACLFWKVGDEVREKVYRMVLCFEEAITLVVEKGQLRLRLQGPQDRKNVLAIAAVCRRARREAMTLFFKENAFFIPVLAFDDVKFATSREETMRLRRSSSLSWLENDAFGCITEFQLSQEQWTTSFKQWVDRLGPANVRSLRSIEISLGDWHLEKPTRFDADIGRALATVRHAFKNPEASCDITMRIGVPNAQLQPCVVQLRLSILSNDKATMALNSFFRKTFRHIDDLILHGKIKEDAVEQLENTILRCQQRLGDFVDVIFAAPPPWYKDSMANLCENLRSAEDNKTIGSSLQKRRSEMKELDRLYDAAKAERRRSAVVKEVRRRSLMPADEHREERRLSRRSMRSYRASQLSAYSLGQLDALDRPENPEDWEDTDGESFIDPEGQSSVSTGVYEEARIVHCRRVRRDEVRLLELELDPVELPTQTTPKAPERPATPHPFLGRRLIVKENGLMDWEYDDSDDEATPRPRTPSPYDPQKIQAALDAQRALDQIPAAELEQNRQEFGPDYYPVALRVHRANPLAPRRSVETLGYAPKPKKRYELGDSPPRLRGPPDWPLHDREHNRSRSLSWDATTWVPTCLRDPDGKEIVPQAEEAPVTTKSDGETEKKTAKLGKAKKDGETHMTRWKKFKKTVRDSGLGAAGYGMDPGAAAAMMALQRKSRSFEK